jgi:hypothetical protein
MKSRFVAVAGHVPAKAASMYNRAGEPHASDASSRAEKPVSRVAGDAPRSHRALPARGVVEHQPQECVLAGVVSRSVLAHLYLQRDEAAFRLWEQHRGEGDGIAGEPYTQAQVLEYWRFCDRMIDDAVDALDLDGSESGFSWYRMSKLEHQLVNIRHIQHHAGQLIDRVRSAADVGIRWVAAR